MIVYALPRRRSITRDPVRRLLLALDFFLSIHLTFSNEIYIIYTHSCIVKQIFQTRESIRKCVKFSALDLLDIVHWTHELFYVDNLLYIVHCTVCIWSAFNFVCASIIYRMIQQAWTHFTPITRFSFKNEFI